jgi:protein subunit release factor A
MNYKLEIRDAEGGTDAKLLVNDMKDIYIKACKNNNITFSIDSEKEGLVCLCL